MAILVVAEHDGAGLKASTFTTLGAAQKIGGDIDVLVAGSGAGAVAEAAAKIAGVRAVLHGDAEDYSHPLAEAYAPLLEDLAEGYTHILVPATTFGKNILPRAGALLDVQPISDISAVIDADTFERPVYAGNAIATVKSKDALKLISVRGSTFDAVAADGGSASVSDVDFLPGQELAKFEKQELSVSERPELTSADIVVSGGRGLGSAENFAMIEKLADKLGAAIGASRAAVDAGYVPNDYQVGQTGKIVAPQLYIAVGISGAIQHLAGMKDSKVIVAINSDEDAPIFQIADYGLVGDLFEAVPELIDKL